MRLTRKFFVETVVEKLAQIRKENGYSCDIGQKVEYGEGIESEPKEDCVAVIDGRQDFGPKTRPGVRPSTLTIYLSAMFYEDNPLERANAAAEDILVWLDKNPSFGITGMRVEPAAFDTNLEPTAQLAELLAELRLIHQ